MVLLNDDCCRTCLVLIVFFYALINCTNTKTAPEFQVTVDTVNFKEIRIPLPIWNKIVSSNYDPLERLNTKPSKKQNKPAKENVPAKPLKISLKRPASEGISADVLGAKPTEEFVIEIVLPAGSNMLPAVEGVEQPLAEAVVAEPLAEVASETVAQVVPAAIGEAASGAPTLADAAAVPGSVLVQSSRAPCTCAKGSCGCCATIFRQKNCAHVSFLPEEFAFEMKMSMNGEVITKRKLPVGDPPPICFNPRRAPFLDLCAQIKNVHIRKSNIHLCIDIDAGLGGFDLFSWNFNCIKFGNKGLFTGLNPEVVTPAGRPKPGGSSLFGFFAGNNDDDDENDAFDDLFDDY